MNKYLSLLVSKKFFFLALAVLITVTACASINIRTEKSTGQIFLYGEAHGVEKIMDRQLEIWYDYYHNQNMRHMFLESAYFTAEFLNIWMQSDNDDILNELFDDWTGTQSHVPHTLVFFKRIKNEFPETIFHGVDVGHQFWSTGKRFFQYLKDNNMQGTKQYLLTQKAIKQGRAFYIAHNFSYRENKMAENFIREFDQLVNQNIMASFGTAHTAFGYSDLTGLPKVPTMAESLRERYDNSLHIEDLSWLALLIDPIRVDIITINGIDYEASYFGTDLTAFKNIVSRSYWRLENAYHVFSNNPVNGTVLPFNNYPMLIGLNQVFIVDATLKDGSVLRLFYRSDEGQFWCGLQITVGFSVE